MTTIVSLAAEDRRRRVDRSGAGGGLGPLPLERYASGWRRQVAYGTVMVVPSPVAVMEKVPAVLDVYV